MNIKHLVIISLFCSVTTLFSTKFGLGEVYPFTSWRLYTEPAYANEPCFVWQIHGISTQGDTLLLKHKAFKGFDFDDVHYGFNVLMDNFEKKPDVENTSRVYSFLQKMHPEFNTFSIKKKKFSIASLSIDSTKYQYTANYVFVEKD